MLVNTPDEVKVVDDYDITFQSGFGMPLTVDIEAGDTITFSDDAILVKLASKPSSTNSTKMLPQEDITIFTKHIVAVQHRERRVTVLTPEQQHAWNQTLSEMISH
jgi:hypothetical protein